MPIKPPASQDGASTFDPGQVAPPLRFGVWGDSDTGAGVIGSSHATTAGTGAALVNPAGVLGVNDQVQGVGVQGRANGQAGTAVLGVSEHGVGVTGCSRGTQAGVTGTAATGPGVSGTSASGPGITGSSTGGPGLSGSSTDGPGVVGSSTGAPGVSGLSASGPGLSGNSGTGAGVSGTSDSGAGVQGVCLGGTGVQASGKVGITASGDPVAGTFSGAVHVTGPLTVGAGAPTSAAGLEIDRGATNDVALRLVSSGPGWGSGLQLSNTAAGARTYGMFSSSDGSLRFTDQGAAKDRLVIDAHGNLGLGTAKPSAGLEIDRGATNDVALRLVSSGPGWGSGLQLSNAAATGNTYGMYAGDDGRWHFQQNGTDLLTVSPGQGGVDVRRRMRVRQGDDLSAGVWFLQRVPNADRAFVGMADDDTVGFWGNGGVGWGLKMNVNQGGVEVARRMSVRQAGDASAGIWFLQDVALPQRAFVGMADNDTVGFWGNGGIGWGLRMDVNQGGVQVFSGSEALQVNGPDVGIRAFGRWAGIFQGGVIVTGPLSKPGGGFRIDHPLHPSEKYLSHSFVESPDMTNLYDGTVVTDDRGRATVVLPTYFEALNRDFQYQLTPIGQLAAATVTTEIKNNTFTIRTDKPRVKVSWQVTGIRHDRWAEAHRITDEEDKPDEERGKFLNPEIHGQPASKNVLAANLPRP
ncbi:hypothetical protein AB0442_35820 [Kitasatospora sp. NPDC085895]|uniref:hypothetical protein n=1 Tax=Kitasatospora sp. NPDC085895 TaxID=3155057 RepID=UPI00344F2332